MIKIEENEDNFKSYNQRQIKDQNLQICLSPFCFEPYNRIFKIDMNNQREKQHTHYYMHDKTQCQLWKISFYELTKPIVPYKIKQLQNIEINFQAQPMQALRTILKLQKSEWKKQLNKQIAQIKKEINKSLDELSSSVSEKLENVLKKGQFYKDLVQIVRKSIDLKPKNNEKNMVYIKLSQQIFQYLQKNQQIISQLKCVTFLNKIQLKPQLQNIQKSIDQLENKLIVQKLGKKQRNAQRFQFYQWIFAQEQNMYGKLQLISSLFSLSPKPYHVEERYITLNCFLCDKYVCERIRPINMKDLKKIMCNQLVIHLYTEHHDKVFFSYMKKISKKNINEVKVKQLFQIMRKYSEIHVIDKQTGVRYTQDFVSSSILAVQLLTLKNVNLAQGSYVILDTRQKVNSLIAILIRQCSKIGKKIIVISKRSEQINQIYKMLEVDKEEGQCKIQFNGNDFNLQNNNNFNLNLSTFVKTQETKIKRQN